MAKYHINSKGDSGICSAEAGGCPFGSESEHHASAEDARKSYEKENATRQFETHKAPTEDEVKAFMPEKFADYFADTEKKHFNSSSSGSTFTELKNMKEVLKEAYIQRGGLDGDDRDKLIARGADPNSFGEDKRYVMIKTKGKLGSISSNELRDDEVLTVVQKSEKTKPVCVVERNSKSDTDFATIVLVDNPTLPGTEGTKTLLITAYPGASGPSGSNNDLLPHVGKTLTVAEAKSIYGREFSVNTVLTKN